MFNMEDEDQISFVELQTITGVDHKIEPEEFMKEETHIDAAENSNQSYANGSINEEYVLNSICEIEAPNRAENASSSKPKKKRIKSSKLKKKKSKSHGSAISAKKNHVKRKSKKNSTDSNKKPKCEYPRLCSGCGHAYKTKQSFWNHKQRCTMLPQNNRSRAVDENGCPIEGENGEYVRRKEYICAHCERPYRKKYNLQEHLKNTCRGKPCSKGRLQCWEEGCLQAFYKYVDLVQHVTLQHGQDLQIQKLQFPNFTAFNNWKTEESNSKFMYARKITGSKRFSNTKYHYFVCQFNHRNEKKNNNRKTTRRKSMNLVVPNYNCPSRIMVKECENVIQVTYISSHNHELNLSNVKYQPLEKETRSYIKTLLGLGVNAKKIIEHLQEGVGNPEIDSFLSTKQHFITLNRIKRMESKLKARNRARQTTEQVDQEKNTAPPIQNDPAIHNDSYSPCNDFMSDPMHDTQAIAACSTTIAAPAASKQNKKESDEVVKSIENNMKKLRGFMHKPGIKEKLSDRISKMIQDLCNECETVDSTGTAPKKARATSRRKKPTPVAPVTLPPPQPQIEIPMHQPQPQMQQAIIIHQQAMMPQQQQLQLQQPQQQQQQYLHQHRHQPQHVIATIDQSCIVNTVVTSMPRQGSTFTPHIDENSDLLKPIFQPFNVNLLALKSLDSYITPHELHLLKFIDESFILGWLCDAVVDSFLNIICQPIGNVLAANTTITQYVQTHHKVPDVWLRYNWNDIDTIFIPCNPSKKHWFLMVVLVKQSELQILDPASTIETYTNITDKYKSSINFWYNVLKNFLGMNQCHVTSPAHAKQNDASDCGVLVCWYVFQYIKQASLLDSLDTDNFRKYIYNTIISSSQPVE